ncbi:phosphate ABC transporter substrate-binding protein [Pseudoalteromonas sp. McH1-42]|uniref:phosphate ABC transporter substrate-binding protein n=1 Tax=Pseudoalteromonas sp. McH1-42 TaxID=2917752 RepID=UPI001EF4311E|nr:phosphate ABC transporter substrate-binding protein [Pseudoalteromonas sp. McH1-42]MCG7561555.1 phosphate ABC transporter substrate-binding protein [Pseudoalteromonas sp. McH1-42]
MKAIIFTGLIGLSSSCWAVDVVVHPSNTATLDKNQIEQIFLGKLKTFNGAGKAVPVSQSDTSAASEEFYSKVIGRSASQLKAYWSKLLFTGKGQPPKKLANDQEVLEMVSSDASIIGYVTSGSADDSVRVIASF